MEQMVVPKKTGMLETGPADTFYSRNKELKYKVKDDSKNKMSKQQRRLPPEVRRWRQSELPSS